MAYEVYDIAKDKDAIDEAKWKVWHKKMTIPQEPVITLLSEGVLRLNRKFLDEYFKGGERYVEILTNYQAGRLWSFALKPLSQRTENSVILYSEKSQGKQRPGARLSLLSFLNSFKIPKPKKSVRLRYYRDSKKNLVIIDVGQLFAGAEKKGKK